MTEPVMINTTAFFENTDIITDKNKRQINFVHLAEDSRKRAEET